MKKKISEDHSRFIEDMGLWFEKFSMPRMMGRIYGWLLICENPQQSSQEICDAVNGSKGSVSTNTRVMVQFGLIERVGIPGKRAIYFQTKVSGWVQWMRLEMMQIETLCKLTESGLKIQKGKSTAIKKRLGDVKELMTAMLEFMPTLVNKMEKKAKELESG